MKKTLKGSFAARLFLSMLTVLLLPVGILYFVYQQIIAQNVAQEVNTIIKNELSASMQLLDTTLENYQEKALFLQRSEGMESYLSHRGFVTDKNGKISSELLTADVTYTYHLSSNADAVFIYFPEEQSVISAGLRSFLSTEGRFFLDQYADLSGKNPQDFILSQNSFSALGTTAITKYGSLKPTISLIHPIDSIMEVYIVFCIDPPSLAQHFTLQTHDMDLTTLVFDKNDRYMFSQGTTTETDLIDAVSQGTLFAFDGQDHSVVHNGRKYLALQSVSSSFQWRGVTLIPRDSPIYTTLFDVDQYFLVIILLTLVVGGLLVYFLVYVNEKPVKELRQENTKLTETVSSNLTAIQRVRLHYLLNDYYASVEEFNTDCEQIGLSFGHPYFYVSTFLIPEDKRASMDLIAQRVSDELCRTIDSKYVFSIKRDQLVFLHNVSSPEEAANLEPFFAALGLLNDQFAFTSAVGIGHVHLGTSGISKSLLQAVNAFEYRFVKGAGAVILCDEIKKDFDSSRSYPAKEIHRLQGSVAAGDMESARRYIDELMTFIFHHELPTYLSRSICADIVKALLSQDHAQEDGSGLLSETLIRLSQAKSYLELKNIVNDVTSSQLHPEGGHTADEDQKLLEDILAYIGENYHRGDFSIQEVALHFSKIPSNMSVFFRDNMNCTMLDYVISLRMTLAKELLRTTTLSLQEICERVGYYNVSSFSRRFKTCEGVPPNTYRFLQR